MKICLSGYWSIKRNYICLCSILGRLNTGGYLNLTKECDCMKGIKIGIVGVCVSLLGIAFAMNNFIAICGAAIGFLLALVGCFV